MSCGITAEAFLKRTAVARADAGAIVRLAPSAIALADHEGFPAHAAALRRRLPPPGELISTSKIVQICTISRPESAGDRW